MLEQITVDLMARLGLDARLRQESLRHGGTNIVCDGDLCHVDMASWTGGQAVTVHGQQEVMKVVRAGARDRCFNTVDLVNQLEDEARRGKAGALAAQLSPLDLVVLDEH